MPYPAVPYNICPCCGTEFGVDNRTADYPTLRRNWIAAGMPWFDDITSPAKNWSPFLQLIEAGFGGDLVSATGHGIVSARQDVPVGLPNWWIPAASSKITNGVAYAQVAGVPAL
jgi:hypothetical protein